MRRSAQDKAQAYYDALDKYQHGHFASGKDRLAAQADLAEKRADAQRAADEAARIEQEAAKQNAAIKKEIDDKLSDDTVERIRKQSQIEVLNADAEKAKVKGGEAPGQAAGGIQGFADTVQIGLANVVDRLGSFVAGASAMAQSALQLDQVGAGIADFTSAQASFVTSLSAFGEATVDKLAAAANRFEAIGIKLDNLTSRVTKLDMAGAGGARERDAAAAGLPADTSGSGEDMAANAGMA